MAYLTLQDLLLSSNSELQYLKLLLSMMWGLLVSSLGYILFLLRRIFLTSNKSCNGPGIMTNNSEK